MEYTYVLISGGVARLIAVVTDDNGDGRYYLYSFEKNNIGHRRFETVKDAELYFQSLVDNNLISGWFPVVQG